MRYLTIFVLLVFTMSVCEAQPANTHSDSVLIRGVGNASCGLFTEHNKEGNPNQMYLYEQWVWGFITAYDMQGSFGTKWHRISYVTPPDAPTILLYLESYCRNHPTNDVIQGSLALIKELGGLVVEK